MRGVILDKHKIPEIAWQSREMLYFFRSQEFPARFKEPTPTLQLHRIVKHVGAVLNIQRPSNPYKIVG